MPVFLLLIVEKIPYAARMKSLFRHSQLSCNYYSCRSRNGHFFMLVVYYYYIDAAWSIKHFLCINCYGYLSSIKIKGCTSICGQQKFGIIVHIKSECFFKLILVRAYTRHAPLDIFRFSEENETNQLSHYFAVGGTCTTCTDTIIYKAIIVVSYSWS